MINNTALDPNPPAFSQRFVRAEEDVLGVSFNVQSQTPDITGTSSREAFSFYEPSLQTQSKSPDIQFSSLCSSTEELLASFNAQDQAPHDPSTQDCQYDPRHLFITPSSLDKCFQGCLLPATLQGYPRSIHPLKKLSRNF